MNVYERIKLAHETVEWMRTTLDQGGHQIHIDMADWGYVVYEGAIDSFTLGSVSDELLDKEWKNPQCETVACFAGWMFVNPKIRSDMRDLDLDEPGDMSQWLMHGLEDEDMEPVHFSPYSCLFSPSLVNYLDDYTVDREGLLDTLDEGLQLFENMCVAADVPA